MVVAYTDGITEAENVGGEGWGQQRLEDFLPSSGHRTAQHVLENIVNEASTFTNVRSKRMT